MTRPLRKDRNRFVDLSAPCLVIFLLLFSLKRVGELCSGILTPLAMHGEKLSIVSSFFCTALLVTVTMYIGIGYER